MEYTQRVNHKQFKVFDKDVLILVLMEYTQRAMVQSNR